MSKRLVVLLAIATFWPTPSTPEPARTPLDVSQLVSQAERLHDTVVRVRGIVTSVCKEGGAFADIVPVSGEGDGVLVSAVHDSLRFPEDSVGKITVVEGLFYTKVYPSSRLRDWHHNGWRAWETTVPHSAKVFRIRAHSIDFEEPLENREIRETPLTPYNSPVFNLNHMEFEAAGMGTGKKYLHAGGDTPEHSSGRYHELLVVIEGVLTVNMENLTEAMRLSPGQACYIPPYTMHSVANKGSERACYVFVYSLPDEPEAYDNRTEETKKHAH